MFPFQQSNSQISSNSPHQDIANQDLNPLILVDQSTLNNYLMDDDGLLIQNSETLIPTSNSNPNLDDKRILRKEIERQRRQQMSKLHASLRTLLPPESIKGKRSMSDHINEAANYIKNLENNVEELRLKRDKLKNASSMDDAEQLHGNQSSSMDRNLINANVTVRSHLGGGGVEIVIACGCGGEDDFHLSKVLEALLEEGFDISGSISTKIDGISYSTIQCQASLETCIDPTLLEQKLNDVILK